jgi:hypothetical protein
VPLRGDCHKGRILLVGEITILVRAPDAGNPPVRFDEREVETEHGNPSSRALVVACLAPQINVNCPRGPPLGRAPTRPRLYRLPTLLAKTLQQGGRVVRAEGPGILQALFTSRWISGSKR